MAVFQNRRKKAVKLQQPIEISWNSFRRGLSLLLQDVELGDEEVRKATNLVLKGKGILTQRPGTAEYFLAGAGKVRAIRPYYPKSGEKQLLALTDLGYLVKKSGASYAILPGASFASGIDAAMAQIYDKIFIASLDVELRRYDGSSILAYAGISRPTNLAATKSSGASGVFNWSWRVSAESDAGETLACEPVELENLPEFLSTENFVTLSWSSVAGAAGYVIYGRDSGNETFLARVPATNLSYIDDGNNTPSMFVFPPEADFTAGPKGKFLIVFKEKLILANIENNPSRIMWSGGGPNIDKFHWSKGGGYSDVSKDDGEELSGVIEEEGKVIAFKERSIYQVSLAYNGDLGIVEPTVQRITGALGCVSHRTIIKVENDVFFVGRRAGGGLSINSLGYEPNILSNQLRTSEISARIAPVMETINQERVEEMWAQYYDQIYWLYYPVGASSMRCIGYDRQRLAFIGPFNFPNDPACGAIWYDEQNKEKYLYGDGDDGVVSEISKGYSNDKGDDIAWEFLSKKEVIKDPLRMKNLVSQLYNLRNVKGVVNIEIIVEDKTGISATTKSMSIAGQATYAGWGSFLWGIKKWGSSDQMSRGISNNADTIKYTNLNKSNIRTFQVKISGTGSRAEIIAIKTLAQMQPATNLPAGWRM